MKDIVRAFNLNFALFLLAAAARENQVFRLASNGTTWDVYALLNKKKSERVPELFTETGTYKKYASFCFKIN